MGTMDSANKSFPNRRFPKRLAMSFHNNGMKLAAFLVLAVTFTHLAFSPPGVPEACAAVPDSDRNWIQRMHDTPCETLGYSQYNMDCTLDTIFAKLGTTNKFFLEYGFNTKEQCSGSGPNTCKLSSVDGWHGLLLDGNNENPAINLRAHYLYGNNIVSILEKYNVPKELDFYSSDMDSHDYFVLDNALKHFRPRVIATEYNSNWSTDYIMSQVDPVLNPELMEESMNKFKFKQCIWGVSASALQIMLGKHGYALIGVVRGLDLIWVRRDLLSCYDVPEFKYFQSSMRLGTLHHGAQTDLKFLNWLADTQVWEETKDLNKARAAAKKKLVDSARAGTHLACFEPVKDLLAAL
eukprot:scaffold81924_cov54-Attheya_sp.AAC.3